MDGFWESVLMVLFCVGVFFKNLSSCVGHFFCGRFFYKAEEEKKDMSEGMLALKHIFGTQ